MFHQRHSDAPPKIGRIRFDQVDEKLVCVVEVDPVDDGVFVGEKGKEFFVRVGNTTKSLDPADTHAYLAART